MQVQYGGGSFFEIGLEFFRIFLDHTGLQRDSAVLDVGCGIGRMALPLTAYLSGEGRYEGFDIMPAGIEHCQKFITPRFQNFRFQQSDVFNAFYNPSGATQAENYVFPYEDCSFDVVFSTSVFTHLAPPAVSQYLRETARVLKPGGFCVHTCYYLDAEALAGIADRLDQQKIRFKMDGFFTSDTQNPEAAIGIPAKTFETMYADAELQNLQVNLCCWVPRKGKTLSYQDVLVARR